MKKITTRTLFMPALAVIFIVNSAIAQSPSTMSYQAVIRKSTNQLVTNQIVGMKISILKGSAAGTEVYSEIQTPMSNLNGLVSIEIGNGAGFSTIDWADGPYFIKTETDPEGGTNYTIAGTSQLLSVPYALHSKTAESISGGITETDPVFGASAAKGISAGNISNWTSAYNWGNHATAGYVKDTTTTVAGDLITYDGNNWVSKKLLIGATGSGQPVSTIQPYLTLNYCIALQGIFPSRNSADPFLGEIELYAFNFEPRGFAQCNGQIMSISQNTALFSLLGTQYGGNGITTFSLPDLRGRVAIHQGQGPGLSPYNIGETGGSETMTLTIQNLPPHTHAVVYE